MAGYGDKDKLADEPTAKTTGGYGTKDIAADEISGPGFIPTVKRTGGQMLTTGARTIEDVTGPNVVTRGMRETGQGIIDRNPSGINELGDIPESPWLTVKEAVGQFVPQIGAAAAGAAGGAKLGFRVGGAPGAAIGAGVGSLLPIASQEYGGIREEQIEGGQESIPRALGAAAGATALERIGMGKVLKGLRGELPAVSTIPREIGKGFVREGATEAAQTAIEQVGAFKDPTAPESVAEQGLAGVMGGIGGGVVGGAQAGIQRALGPYSDKDQPAPDASMTPGTDVVSDAPPAAGGDPLRTAKLPETGMLTAAVNAGIEAEAQAADAGAPVQAPISGALAGVTPPQQQGDASKPGGGDQQIPAGEASEVDPETVALFDPASATIATPERASFGSREEVEQHLSQQRRSGGSKQGKALPVDRGDGRWSFAREGEPEFEGAQQAQEQREADDRMRADQAFEKALPTMPQHLRDLKPADRKTFGLDKAVEMASRPQKTNEPIGEEAGASGVAYTPERAVMQAHNYQQAVKTQDGMLRSGNRTGATTGGLIGSWMNQRQAQLAIEQSRKANPEMWAAYDERQKGMAELKPGDQVLTPYPSPEFPLGTPGKLVRKFGVNWRVEYPDGNTVMVPPTALRPGPRAEAAATVTTPAPQTADVPAPVVQSAAQAESGEDAPQARWTRATTADRTALLADAGWSVNPPSLSTKRVLAQPWDKLTDSQRDRLTAALAKRDAPRVSATSTDDAALDAAAHVAATSHLNDLAPPTGPQLGAGNYQKGHHRLASIGHGISIETAKGTERVAKDGSWRVPNMPAHYGDINRTEGADGDPVDIFIGDRGDNGRYWVINQNKPGGGFDEHKVITGVDSADEAVAIYKGSFTAGFGDKVFASISAEYDPDALKALLPSLKKAKAVPASEQTESRNPPAPAGPEAAADAAPPQVPAPAPAAPAPSPSDRDAEEGQTAAASADATPRTRSPGIAAPRPATRAEMREIRQRGVPAASIMDAEKALTDGDAVYRAHDQDEGATQVFSHVDLDGYTADQITIVRAAAAPPTAAPAPRAQDASLTMPDERIDEYAGKTITLQAMVADTGGTVDISLDAATAIRDIRKRMQSARELVGCLA
jgi:hypothetical protein